MRFSTRERFRAPPERVFEALTDFDRFEALIGPRLLRLDRVSGDPAWEAEAEVRGMRRSFATRVVERIEPERLALETVSGAVLALLRAELAHEGGVTETRIALDLSATSMAGRLFLGSLKLTKPALDDRFRLRVSDLAERIRPGVERA